MLLRRGTLFVDENGHGSYTVPPEDQTMLDLYTAVERNLLYSP